MLISHASFIALFLVCSKMYFMIWVLLVLRERIFIDIRAWIFFLLLKGELVGFIQYIIESDLYRLLEISVLTRFVLKRRKFWIAFI